ncbi:hypothetical protein CBL_11066 [Carabus blaptoides fortunei]
MSGGSTPIRCPPAISGRPSRDRIFRIPAPPHPAATFWTRLPAQFDTVDHLSLRIATFDIRSETVWLYLYRHVVELRYVTGTRNFSTALLLSPYGKNNIDLSGRARAYEIFFCTLTSSLHGLNVEVKRTGNDINWNPLQDNRHPRIVHERNSHLHPTGTMSQTNRPYIYTRRLYLMNNRYHSIKLKALCLLPDYSLTFNVSPGNYDDGWRGPFISHCAFAESSSVV